MPRPDEVPRLARPFVALLLAAMVASAVFVWEPWPLTSFRLFSHVRADAQSGWRATTVETDGTELAYPLDSLGRGLRNFGFRMTEFAAADEARRDELCRTWVAVAPEVTDRDVVEVRLYERHWLLSARQGDRALPGAEQLMFICTGEGVQLVR
jgi:hypothetical protein